MRNGSHLGAHGGGELRLSRYGDGSESAGTDTSPADSRRQHRF